MNQVDLRSLADERILDAKALLDGQRWSFAYYTAGYAVECALKSCVLARMVITGGVFEEKWKPQDYRTHDFEELVKLAGLSNELTVTIASNANFRKRWDIVLLWDVSVRYAPKTQTEAVVRGDHSRPRGGDAMVAEVLVAENRIEDGRILLTRLVRGGLEIGVAFWLRLDDRDRWRLFIACPALAGVRRDVAVTQLFEELQKMPFAPFDFNSVRLVSDTTPAPAEAMALRDNTGRGRPVWIKESGQLGEYNYEEAYIYERISAALTRDEVIQNVLHLMERPGLPPSKLIRRDGSTVQGIPVGLVTHSPGTEVLVSIFDPATRTTDTVPAADIVNIE